MRRVLKARLIRMPRASIQVPTPEKTGEQVRLQMADRARRLLNDVPTPSGTWVLQSY